MFTGRTASFHREAGPGAINQRAFGAAWPAGQATVSGWEDGFRAADGALLAVLMLPGVRLLAEWCGCGRRSGARRRAEYR